MLRFSTRSLPLAIVVLAIVWFFVAAGRDIALPGLDYDELTFVSAATGGESALFVTKRVLGIPVMVMDYYGALKAYLYAPIFALFGASAATIRWPVILISGVSLVLIYRLGRLTFGALGAAMLTVMAAVDPVFIWLTKLDYGPIVLMMVLKLGALYAFYRALLARSAYPLWIVAACCALGVFDKLNFIWFVIALGVAAVTLFPRELAATYRRGRLAFVAPVGVLATTMTIAGVVVIAPLFAATQRSGSSLSTLERIRWIAGRYARTMDGREVYAFMTGTTLDRPGIVNYVTTAALVVLLGLWLARARRRARAGMRPFRLTLRERFVAAYVVLFVVIAAQIVVTRRAGGPHHQMRLYPSPFMLVVAAATWLVRWAAGAPAPRDARSRLLAARVVATLAIASLVASELSVSRAYAAAFAFEGRVTVRWSPRIYDLAEYLNAQRADRIVFADWGMRNQVYALGTERTRRASRDLWLAFRRPGAPEREAQILADDFGARTVLAVLHPRGEEMVPGAQDNFLAWVRARRMTLQPVHTIADRSGRVVYEVYAVSESD
jgi:4-amino-4-deoxy-L-arabinose transferase-like glycosyltransferase